MSKFVKVIYWLLLVGAGLSLAKIFSAGLAQGYSITAMVAVTVLLLLVMVACITPITFIADKIKETENVTR